MEIEVYQRKNSRTYIAIDGDANHIPEGDYGVTSFWIDEFGKAWTRRDIAERDAIRARHWLDLVLTTAKEWSEVRRMYRVLRNIADLPSEEVAMEQWKALNAARFSAMCNEANADLAEVF